jgi:hypothetical protein
MDLAPQALDPAASPPQAPAAPLVEAPPPTSIADLDRAAAAVAERADAFVRVPPREKAALLRACLPHVLSVAPEMVALACRSAGVDPASPLAGAGWLSGPAALCAAVRRFAEALDDVATNGRPSLPATDLRGRAGGRVVARLQPRSFPERAFQGDAEASAIFAEGVEPEDVIAGQAPFYRQGDPVGRVALVLAAGGPPSAGPLRALEAMFVEGKVAVLETTRATAYLGPLVERALAPLVEARFLRVVHGGDAPGDHLSATLGEPRIASPGRGGPVIVVPGYYAKDELQHVARRLASEVAAGAAFEVTAPRAVVTASCWAQRAMFVDQLGRALAELPPHLTRPIVADLAPDDEPPAWGVSLFAAGCDDPAALLGAAVERCNAWPGTTDAEIVAHVIHEEDPEVAAALDRAVVALRCEALGINQWPALLAFRGDTPSGPWMLARVDKAVVRGPLRPVVRPSYFYDASGARRGARICAFQAAPSVGGLLRGAWG